MFAKSLKKKYDYETNRWLLGYDENGIFTIYASFPDVDILDKFSKNNKLKLEENRNEL